MKRTVLNFWTDTLAFIGFIFLITTGVLLRYQLPPGSGRVDGRGVGHQAQERSVGLVWGLSRHEWGHVHYCIALGLMVVLAFHLVLHWKWIVCVTRGKPVKGSGYRLGLGLVGLLAALLLAVAPLLSSRAQMPRSDLQQGTAEESHADDSDKAIRGQMTLAEVETQTGVPVSHILTQLGLPPTTSPDVRLGQLREKHGFQIDDVRRIVSDFQVQ